MLALATRLGGAMIMAHMQKLSADTVRLITSSQVITSVVSVVKELVENALDGGSDNVEIILENYGFDKIEVRDNGSGIKPDDAPYMAQRHFTSKISHHADLESLATYGFRGEALGSLCAVSSVTIVTKTLEDDFGHQYVLDHRGGIVTSKPSHLGIGTTVTTTHLFKNVPVRKQYYTNAKRRRDELKKVEDLIMSYGAILPAVRFSLSHNKSTLWQKSKVTNHKAALINTWGSSVVSQMQHVQRLDNETEVRIEGFVPALTADSQSATRVLPDRCWIAINGRPVIFKDIEKMVKQSYSQAVKHDTTLVRHLVMFLNITLPQHHVDVNLEPNKTKVLLQNKETVLSVLSDLLHDVYGKAPEEHTAGAVHKLCPPHQEDNIIHDTLTLDGPPEGSTTYNTNSPFGDEVYRCDDDKISACQRTELNCDRECTPVFQLNDFVKSNKQDKQDSGMPVSNINAEPKELAENSVSVTSHQKLPSSSHNDSVDEPASIDFQLDCSIFDDGDFQLENFDENAALSTSNETESGKNGSTDVVTLDHSTEGCDLPVQKDSIKNVDTLTTSVSLTDWSKGRGLTNNDGKPVEPARLLIPNNANERLVTNHVTHNELSADHGTAKSILFDLNPASCTPGTHSHINTTTATRTSNNVTLGNKNLTTSPANQEADKSSDHNRSPASRRLSLEKKIGKGIMYDLIGQSPVRKPQSPFEFFSKEMRPQELQKNPRASFSDITKAVDEQWRQMEEEKKEKYEEMGRKDVARYHSQLKAAQRKLNLKQGMNDDAPARKKKKLSLPANQGLIDKMLLSQQQRRSGNQVKEPETPDISTLEVSFSLIGLERELKSHHDIRKTEYDYHLHLIGQLASHDVWLAHRDNQVVVFNQYRAEETLLYHRLMAHHMLPYQHLDIPIILSPSMVGGDDNWRTLLGLPHQTYPPDPAVYHTDNRLTANGFEIKQTIDSETKEVKLQVIAMATSINYYGLGDLQEILGLIRTSPSVALSQCRPLKVANYLKGEAVRMARNLPSSMQTEDILDVIKRMKQLPTQCRKCLHNQPFEYALCTIPESDDYL